MDLKSTLNLPDPDFTIPMKADLPAREPERLRQWQSMGVYHRILEHRRDAPTFLLHDGPPYTNSPIHVGTAFNKVLKDLVVKSRTLLGHRAPYVPGFDNHGLPIEQAVMRAFAERKETPDVATLRSACREHARKYLDVQTRQFERLGVFGLWEKPYTTMDFRYEAEIVRVFKRLVEAGYVYRGLRPVLWSPSQRTALADTEIVYQDVVSKSVYVRFRLREDPYGYFADYPGLSAIIWTTTPWTLPANMALAFHPEMRYSIVRAGSEWYVVHEALVASVMRKIGVTEWEQVASAPGESFRETVFWNSLMDRPSVAVEADYVTAEEGSGIVHTAPGHGREDFMTGMKYGLKILCPVDERGYLTSDAGDLAGTFYKDCDTVVLERLRASGDLLAEESYGHSYPHSERDGKPVIFRTTEQWFVSVDHDELRRRMLHAVEHDVTWHPDRSMERFLAMMGNRPDWCISRQRPWGVGIPIFYGAESGAPVMDGAAIECVARLVESQGSDAWFTVPPEEILPPGYTHPDSGETRFVKETDVLDVWFDSGCTSICVLEGNVEPQWKEDWPADLYLEGSDQHRGWFNTSLILAMALRGAPPYREVLTHGFVVDESGRKLSKRLGNDVDPEDVFSRYGADVLRYWVASVDYSTDVPLSDNILKQVAEHYRRVRNTLRFLLGNLYDYAPCGELAELDRWFVEQSELLAAEVADAYRAYDFNRALSAVHAFCLNEASSFYLDAIKDRMYCESADSPPRRSAQEACWRVLNTLVRLVAPVLPFTGEEVYERVPAIERLDTVHAETLDVPPQERRDEIAGSELQRRIAALLAFRAELFAAFETWKAGNDAVKDSQDAFVRASTDATTAQQLCSFDVAQLANLLKVSWIELAEGATELRFERSPYFKCERCRLRRPDVAMVGEHELCERCAQVVGRA